MAERPQLGPFPVFTFPNPAKGKIIIHACVDSEQTCKAIKSWLEYNKEPIVPLLLVGEEHTLDQVIEIAQPGKSRHVVAEDVMCVAGASSRPVFILVVVGPTLNGIKPFVSFFLHEAQSCFRVDCLGEQRIHPSSAYGSSNISSLAWRFVEMVNTSLAKVREKTHTDWTTRSRLEREFKEALRRCGKDALLNTGPSKSFG